jgi:hypothetical protein
MFCQVQCQAQSPIVFASQNHNRGGFLRSNKRSTAAASPGLSRKGNKRKKFSIGKKLLFSTSLRPRPEIVPTKSIHPSLRGCPCLERAAPGLPELLWRCFFVVVPEGKEYALRREMHNAK